MSWSFTIPGGTREEFKTRADRALEQANLQGDDLKQAQGAIGCTTQLVNNVGAGWLDTIPLSGHTNPGHKMEPGMPAEFISVHIPAAYTETVDESRAHAAAGARAGGLT